jgi:hypothetical protein
MYENPCSARLMLTCMCTRTYIMDVGTHCGRQPRSMEQAVQESHTHTCKKHGHIRHTVRYCGGRWVVEFRFRTDRTNLAHTCRRDMFAVACLLVFSVMRKHVTIEYNVVMDRETYFAH